MKLALAWMLAANASFAATPLVTAVVLGTAQDAGVPQANCRCERCAAARLDPARQRLASSLALLDREAHATFVIDATPDFRAQLDILIRDPQLALRSGRNPLDGLLLTHAHIGHYAGLVHLGREVMSSSSMPVYASARMSGFLESNGPWSQLVTASQICLVPLVPDQRLALSPHIRVTPLNVPHRDEYSDTLAFRVDGPRKSLLWLPDIDKWHRWDRSLRTLLDDVDYAFLDATFFSGDELPDRKIDDIPHPLVSETIALVTAEPRPRARVFLIHMNHSNPLVGDHPEALRAVREAGFEVAREGLRLDL